MKRAMFTLFQRQRVWPKVSLTLMFILTWGLLSISSLEAQIVTGFSPNGDTCKTTTFTTCMDKLTKGNILFTDDNMLDGLYADSRPRRDTVEICPKDQWHRVKVVLTEFDLDEGDTLFAYNADKKTIREYVASGSSINTGAMAPFGAGSGTGTGVSKGFGGWIDASCNPKENYSGCLTFIFKTDGDNNKGKGWEAWVGCEKRDIQLGPVSIPSKILELDSAAYAHMRIPAPLVRACGDTLQVDSDSVRVQVKNQLGIACIDTVLTYKGMANAVWDTFAVGTYVVEYTLLVDKTKTLTVPFSVQAPALVCNDNINIPFGSACIIQLHPDDLLEQPVDTITDTLYYNLTITLGTGKNQVVKTTSNYDNHGAVSYPVITEEDIKKAGISICGGTATVKVERIYYGIGGIATICNNGPQYAACETRVHFTDQSAPFINVPAIRDTLIACDTTGLSRIITATAIDNCDKEVPVTIAVKLSETDPCFNNNGRRDTTTAIVIYTAVDDCGNVGSTTREVLIIRPNEQEHIAKTTNLTLECNEVSINERGPGLKIGLWKNNKFEVRDTIALSTTDYKCGYILTRKDLEIPTADCGKKLYRYWSVVDWCTPGVGPTVVDTQLIKHTDTKAPTFMTTDSVKIIEVGAFECTYDITKLKGPAATDNCSQPQVHLDSVFRIEDGLPWPVSKSLFTQLDVDSFHLRWIAEDDCHEQLKNDTFMQLVVLKDVTLPTAVCTDRLNISVGSNSTVIDTGDVDAGSYDACGILKREISRDGINFGPRVTFTCDDIKDTVQIILKITDTNGNVNSCWLNVHPEDKIRPICRALPTGISYANGDTIGKTADVRINCDESKVAAIKDRNKPTAAELALIGGPLPAPLDNCPNAVNVELEPVVIQNGVCATSIYQRRWIARDVWGSESTDTCTQLITVEYVEDWEIKFPDDKTLYCPVQSTAADSVTLKNGTCDKLAVSVQTKMFDVVTDACFKVIKTYHIINWCNYKAGDAPTHTFNKDSLPADMILRPKDIPNLSYITYTQVIKVDDNEAPIVTLGETDSCLVGDHDTNPNNVGSIEACGDVKSFSATATDCVTGIGRDLSYTYKIYRGTIKEVEQHKATVIEQSQTSTQGNSAIVIASVLPGTYTSEFTFTDNCGNSTLQRKEYYFKDCKKPTPYLLNGIAIEIMQHTAQIDIWANDFDQGSFDNCTEQDSLDIRIWHTSLGFNAPTTVEGVLDSLPTSVIFDCNYLGTQIVNIYVIDKDNNYDYAATYVQVQDNMNACQNGSQSGQMMVAGEILNYNGESIEGVEVKVSGGSEEVKTTQSNGHYEFMLPTDEDYTITPEKNTNPLNGVSTFDLVLISKHILGVTPFDSPYKYIAADVNRSGTISAFDMVQLRQLILNVMSEFPNNTSWRFLEKGHQFSSENPAAETFNEMSSIVGLKEDKMNTDFIGVKIGDVNNNASNSSWMMAENRSSEALKFNLADQLIEKGQFVEVDFSSQDIESIQGYQFTMNFTGLDFEGINGNIVKEEHFNTKMADKGILTSSWNGEAKKDEILFTLRFKATKSGLLSDFLALSSKYTPIEAYNTEDEIMDISLDFGKIEQGHVFELQQNTPNPFKKETVIGFYLPEAGAATLKIWTVQGKIVKVIKGNYEKGYNQIRLDATTLNATGILHYHLESANYTATKKMIIIE
jgi:hypothetical protein